MKGRAKSWVAANREAAAIIASDVARYGGEGAALVQWARLVLSNAAREQQPATGRAA